MTDVLFRIAEISLCSLVGIPAVFRIYLTLKGNRAAFGGSVANRHYRSQNWDVSDWLQLNH